VTDDDARCVLCQQELTDDGKARLRRFDEYMRDTTEQDASTAERVYEDALLGLSNLVVVTPRVTTAVATLTAEDDKLGNATQSLLTKLEEQHVALLAHLRSDDAAPTPLPAVDLPDKIHQLSATLEARAAQTDVDKFQADLQAVTKRKDELRASVTLCESADLLRAEVVRKQRDARLQAARGATDTSAITQKSSQLTREYATKVILDEFTRETERLRLQRVTLEDLGGQKGQLTQKPGLLGAKHRAASAQSVLSEGEQTALGLAGFFTEAVFDTSRSAIVFDDPVTSLDHVRRDKVAERLAQLAQDRQVIVFTHDVNFTGDLVAAAEKEKVTLTERSVERRGPKPGACLTTFPWKAKDFKARLDHLRTELARVKKDRAGLSQTEYEERVANWAGYLSETWERCVTSEILNQVFDRGTSFVQPRKFRLLAQITEADDQDFQDGYGSTSKWARRHDKAPGTNYVAPEPDELETELERITAWQKRIRSYL
jgi:ABC-type molybdenum transport system ATPase subunit/photorepair protein PhrA